MMYYDPHIITLRLSPPFVRQLESETKFAALAQEVHTIIPSSLLQLATIVLSHLESDQGNSNVIK